MVRRYIINISNYLDVPLNYDVYNGKKLVKCNKNGNTYRYEFEASEGDCIRICKENKWMQDDKSNIAFMLIFSLDLVWGNIMESDNLPIGADFQKELAQENQIYLNDYDFLTTTDDSIKYWVKGAYIQHAMLLLTLAFICYVFYKACTFPINIIICTLILIGSVLILLKSRKKMLKMRSSLKKYLHK